MAQAVEILHFEDINGKVPDARVMMQKVEGLVEMAADTKMKVRVLVEELRELLVISFRQGMGKLHPAAFRTGGPQLGCRDRRPNFSQEWKVKHGGLSRLENSRWIVPWLKQQNPWTVIRRQQR
jgi:hypothetical protein